MHTGPTLDTGRSDARSTGFAWWPVSLVGRVFLLYALTFTSIALVGVFMLYHHEFESELVDTVVNAKATLAVVSPVVAENAVTGDFDSIRTVLSQGAGGAHVQWLAFSAAEGGRIEARNADAGRRHGGAPDWLRTLVQERLEDMEVPINVGGRDYGRLRLSFAADRMAGELWEHARATLVLTGTVLLLGLVLIRIPLVAWLGRLPSEQRLQLWASNPHLTVPNALASDVPPELQPTFAALDQLASAVRAQQVQAQITLAAIPDAVFTLDPNGLVLLANPPAQALAAHSGRPVLGQSIHELLPGALQGNSPQLDALQAATSRYLRQTGPEPEMEPEARLPWEQAAHRAWWPVGFWKPKQALVMDESTEERELELSLSVVRGSRGELAGFVLICHDRAPRAQGFGLNF